MVFLLEAPRDFYLPAIKKENATLARVVIDGNSAAAVSSRSRRQYSFPVAICHRACHAIILGKQPN